jgi:hypothetical protein
LGFGIWDLEGPGLKLGLKVRILRVLGPGVGGGDLNCFGLGFWDFEVLDWGFWDLEGCFL